MKKNRFEHFGVMIDMSRNSVMSVDGLKSYLPLLKKMGYNTVMLYTEDTYEVDGEPYFGYMRGRYTKEELKELDAYVTSLGMELIPCIQTLAHLNALVRWGKHPVDCNDILLVDDPKTYEFIERLFATLSQCFTSKLIHIGMDEAFMLGRGRHLDLYGYETKTAIIKRHLDRVSEIATKYGYKCLMWSDMFFSWADGYYQPRIKIELCGLCTDICVISNAMILKAEFPETRIVVDASCCAGVTKDSHKTALDAMRAVQIDIINENKE